MGKVLRRVILALVLLVVLSIVVLFFAVNTLAKQGMNASLTYALGVDSRVQSVRLGLFSGNVRVEGLKVSNPEGYTTDHLMQFETFDVKLQPMSLFSDTVKLERLELDNLDLIIEQRIMESNASVVLGNLERLKKESPKEPGKTIEVDYAVIRDVTAHFVLMSDLSSDKPITVQVPEIEISQFSTANRSGYVAGELARQLVPLILAAVVEKGQGTVPGDFLNPLELKVSSSVESLTEQARVTVEGVKGRLEDLLTKPGESESDEEPNRTGLGGLLKGLDKEDSDPAE